VRNEIENENITKRSDSDFAGLILMINCKKSDITTKSEANIDSINL
jgi:hypothetical protein